MTKKLCVDAAHGRFSVDQDDEFGEGFPASWCVANHEDKVLLTNFFLVADEHGLPPLKVHQQTSCVIGT